MVLAADSMYDMSGSFDFVMGARDCDYHKVGVPDLFRVVCECDVWVVICSCEFPDLASIYVEADRLQVAGERECERESDVAETGDADGFVAYCNASLILCIHSPELK